jgi:hypothetical protein
MSRREGGGDGSVDKRIRGGGCRRRIKFINDELRKSRFFQFVAPYKE